MKRFWLFCFLLWIPSQLTRHFWPEWSLVMGLRVDYLAIRIYLLDLIWLLLAWSYRKEWWTKKFRKTLVWLLVIGALNCMVASVWQLALVRWLRIGQAVLSLVILNKERVYLKKTLKKVIPYWVLTEAFLALAQVVKGGSVQGIFYWLGERKFSLNTIGIAQMSVGGTERLRAYGTFSHPNSLAGFLMMSLLLWEKVDGKKNWWWWGVWWSGVVGIILAGSRLVWAFLAVYWIYKGWKSVKETRKRIGLLMIMSGVFVLGFAVMAINYRTSDYLGGWDKESFIKRWDLLIISLRMWRDNFWLGAGANNFLVRLPDYLTKNGVLWLQPVHNVLMYLLTELGLLGTGGLAWIIWKNRWWRIRGKYWILALILITGMWDHYWLSLWQNWWLMLVVLVL